MKRIGVALGAGGARGLAHIALLEVFDDLGVMPAIIAGTSIGAVVGAGYAAGHSAKEMKAAVEELRSVGSGRFWPIGSNSETSFSLAWLDPTMESGGLIRGEKFFQFLRRKINVERFEDLTIPLRLVATNYWKREQVILQKGNLMKAVQASYALPGLLVPVKIGRDLMVDGGLMNPLPFDIIQPHCDISVAIDVSVKEVPKTSHVHAQEVLFSAFQILQNSIVREKLRHSQPDILITTNIRDVHALEFKKLDTIFEQTRPAKEELKRKLEKFLNERR